MKTIILKNAGKFFFFSLMLCSAEAFSFTQIPSVASSSGNESRTSFVKKSTSMSKATPKTYAATYKSSGAQSKGKKLFKR